MPFRRAALAAVVSLALLASGCARSSPPEITVYTDGTTIAVPPLHYCDVLVQECAAGEPGRLTTRPGRPVQISVPREVAETPWLISVQSASADGTPLPVIEEFFSRGERFAYTAVPARPDQRILVIEVQQPSGAYAADADGRPILDENGRPQLVARGVWSVQFSAG